MCDVSRMRFFRPWNIAGSIETNETSTSTAAAAAAAEKLADTTTTAGGIADRREIDVASFKCEPMMFEADEDNESVVSSMSCSSSSVATSETGSYTSRRSDRDSKVNRRRSISSLCSTTNSCEDSPAESRSLDMLSNLVYGTTTREETAGNAIGNSGVTMVNINSSSSESSSCASRSSPLSAFAPPPTASYQQYPAYPFLDYLSPLSIGFRIPSENAAAAACAAHHPHRHLLYGLPGAGMPLGPYGGGSGSSVEEAVKYIHQQDAAARQMKKLRPKKFRCEHCDVAFSNNGQLKGHVRIHTGERPFKCDAESCGKSFTRNEELTRHKRIHTGLRPHACLLCGKRFGRKDHLKKHTRTHENRAAYHISASALGPFALSHHSLPPGHPMSSYIYPV